MSILSAEAYYDEVHKVHANDPIISRTLYFGGVLGNLDHSVLSFVFGALELTFCVWFPKDGSWANRRASILDSFKDARLSEVVYGLIKTINPNAQVDRKAQLAYYYADLIKKQGEQSAKCNQPIFSRLCYVLYTVVAPITRLLDLMMGTYWLALAILCLGRSKELNSMAFTSFDGTLFIHDFFYGLIRIFNPNERPEKIEDFSPPPPKGTYVEPVPGLWILIENPK